VSVNLFIVIRSNL